tara:strand:- start:1977 stop:2507 length:531 start_codon:yes stop_codon:yes gene_type:complete
MEEQTEPSTIITETPLENNEDIEEIVKDIEEKSVEKPKKERTPAQKKAFAKALQKRKENIARRKNEKEKKQLAFSEEVEELSEEEPVRKPVRKVKKKQKPKIVYQDETESESEEEDQQVIVVRRKRRKQKKKRKPPKVVIESSSSSEEDSELSEEELEQEPKTYTIRSQRDFYNFV